MVALICIVLFLAMVAYIVSYMKVPEPYGKIIQVILLIALIYAVGKFLTTGSVGVAF